MDGFLARQWTPSVLEVQPARKLSAAESSSRVAMENVSHFMVFDELFLPTSPRAIPRSHLNHQTPNAPRNATDRPT